MSFFIAPGSGRGRPHRTLPRVPVLLLFALDGVGASSSGKRSATVTPRLVASAWIMVSVGLA